MAAVERESVSEANALARFMGLPRWAKIEDLDLVEHVERGMPTRTVEVVLRRLDPAAVRLKPTDVIPKATYYRLKDGRLSREQSERVFWLAKVLREVMRIYHDDAELSLSFLTKGHAMLGGRRPYDLAKDSVSGAALVLEQLGRLEAGVAV